MESAVPSSIDIPLDSRTDYALDAPMAFRRERFWFISFLMTPFKDIDQRAVEQPAPLRRPKQRRR
jgi:hypothetical protein